VTKQLRHMGMRSVRPTRYPLAQACHTSIACGARRAGSRSAEGGVRAEGRGMGKQAGREESCRVRAAWRSRLARSDGRYRTGIAETHSLWCQVAV
jgi:hypothetical protein